MQLEFDPAADLALALILTPGLGPGGVRKILERRALTGEPDGDLFRKKPADLEAEYSIPKRAAAALGSGARSLMQDILSYKARVKDKPVRIITFKDALYPERLEAFCKTPPGFLVCYGNMGALKARTFTALASRDVDQRLLDKLEKTVEEGVLDSLILVTGANTPGYQRAAVVPLRWGAPRVLVLDRGIFQALGEGLDQEPFPAARLWRYRFDPETDLVVSFSRPDDGGTSGSNKRRDELVAALSDEVRVAHMRKGGNIEALARRAEAAGRVVRYL